MVTSTRKEDYLGRNLVNANPGVTNPVTDYIGRTTTATVDYLGRLLTSLPWPGAVPVVKGAVFYLAVGEIECTIAGTPLAGAPALPANVGDTVVSDSATFIRTE